MRRGLGLATIRFLLLAPVLQAQVTFDFTYQDVALGTGIGFDDPLHGAIRRDALQQAGDALFGSLFDHDTVVDILVAPSTLNGGATLANGGTYYFMTANSFQPGLVSRHVTTGTDPYASAADGSLTWDFGSAYSYDDTPEPGECDFASVAVHELMHAFGLTSAILANGDSAITTGTYTVFDSYLVDFNGTSLIDPASHLFQVPTNTLTNGVWFNGPNAVAANGGNPVPLYTPSTFDGSSLSHLDPSLGSLVSLPILTVGDTRRVVSPVELGIFADLGYQLASPVPEPHSALLVGLGALAALRRKMPAACPRA